MIQTIQYESQTSGLWQRFISKLITSWILIYITVTFCFIFAVDLIEYDLYLLIVGGTGIIIATYFNFKNAPLKWNNTVTIDFQNELFLIENKRPFFERSKILDFEGTRITFNEIKYYSTINYETALLNSNYLIKIHTKAEEFDMIAFTKPTDFLEFSAILKNQIRLKLK